MSAIMDTYGTTGSRSSSNPPVEKKSQDKIIEELVAKRITAYQQEVSAEFDSEISILRSQAQTAEKHARAAKWTAVASVIVTIVVIIFVIVLI